MAALILFGGGRQRELCNLETCVVDLCCQSSMWVSLASVALIYKSVYEHLVSFWCRVLVLSRETSGAVKVVGGWAGVSAGSALHSFHNLFDLVCWCGIFREGTATGPVAQGGPLLSSTDSAQRRDNTERF